MSKVSHLRVAVPLTLLVVLGLARGAQAQSDAKVTVSRVPEGGIQPQVEKGADGTVHLIYYQGSPRHGDILYVRSTDGGDSFSSPIRVNSQEGSALGIGVVSGPHLAVGRRVHVVWNGSHAAEPKAPEGKAPVLYSRMNDDGIRFEPQRNIIQARVGIDGGSSVAADGAGRVYVVWHAPEEGKSGEQHRKVWIARSLDDGQTFSRETAASRRPTGACACCSLRAFADAGGTLHVLYRSAKDVMNRDTYLLTSADQGATFASAKLHGWKIGQCVMSTSSFADGVGGTIAAWETHQQVYLAVLGPATSERSAPIAAPGRGDNRKHPVVAANQRGQVILAWTEGTSWGTGGDVAWQVFDREGQPLLAENGRAPGLPVWGTVAVFARPDGTFTVVY